MFSKISKLVLRHKVAAGVALVIAIVISVYFGFKTFAGNDAQTRYVLANVEKGTIISSISGSGQVSAASQIDIKAKASGDVMFVGIKNGQEVGVGTLLVRLDNSDAQKSVRDAQANLDSAKISLQKLQKPIDSLSLMQTENSLAAAQDTKTKAEDNLQKTYEDGFNSIANAFLDLPDIMSGLDDILFSSSLGESSQWNLDYFTNAVENYDAKIFEYRDATLKSYQKARAEYDKAYADYKSTSRLSDTATVGALIDETYTMTKDVAESIKNNYNLIQFYKDQLTVHNMRTLPEADTLLTELNGCTGTANGHLSDLLSVKNSIESGKQAIIDAQRSIDEKTQSLEDLKAGTDPLDLQSQELTLKQRQNALADARETLSKYYVYAPFDGVMASIDVKKGDSVSSGTALATIITKQKIAEISLNEVDAAKVKVGQKATLTFDAIESLSITGQVADIDTLGTVSQGVVSYSAKISFDTQDERIKPGMSVSASIITDSKVDVLVVPSSAIKTLNDANYVLILDQKYSDTSSQGVISLTIPSRQSVEVGLSDDTNTEIISGLNEGDQIVSRTVTSATAKSTTSSAPSLFGSSNRQSDFSR
ncbi:MAG: efflux RND transporter periplasmic adaptor subunit [Patescibacteria group bacterium]|nr:efflux RND transporter periplasmic adaptor subunit [Patescibacteria group bacterium]